MERPWGSSSRCIRLRTPPYFGVSARAELQTPVETASTMVIHSHRFISVSSRKDCSQATRAATADAAGECCLRSAKWCGSPSACPLGGEPAERAAQVRVPDVARRIDGDAEWAGVAAWKRKLDNHAVAETAQSLTAQLGEPHRTVGRDRERRQSRRFRWHEELGELPVDEAADLVCLHLQEPHGAVGTNCDVAKLGGPCRRIQFGDFSARRNPDEPVEAGQRAPDRPT